MQAGLQILHSRPSILSRLISLSRVPGIGIVIVFLASVGILALIWVPLAPERLFDFDAANFALALNEFQPALHQPQPPGYPLYVGLTRIIDIFFNDPPTSFLVAGLLGAAAVIVMLWLLGERMFGRRAGAFAALLFMTNPVVWQTGMSDQVRIYIAVISVAISFALWPLWEGNREASSRRLVLSCLLLGFLAGFRPESLMSLAPLVAVTAIRNRTRPRYYLIAALALCIGMAPWLIVLLLRVGGIGGLFDLMRIYSAEQAGKSSLLFGASWVGAWKMITGGLWWASLGIVTWLPAVFLVRWTNITAEDKRNGYFLVVWFLALFLFSIAIHIAASGHALGFIPVLCVAGGWVLSAVGKSLGRWIMALCLTGALSLNVVFFFHPYSRQVIEASNLNIKSIAGVTERTLDRIDSLIQTGPAILVSDGEWVSWRILEYYYPSNQLIYLPSPLALPSATQTVWLFEERHRTNDLNANTELPLPSCGTIIWLVSDDQSRKDLLAVKDAESHRYFITTPARPGMHFRLGRYRLATSPRPCSVGIG